jgi:hypothetical protein
MLKVRVVLLVVLAAVWAPLLAQMATATLSGIVSDPTHSVIVNVTVQLSNVDTNVSQTAQTNQAGLYTFASVPPGRYDIAVKHAGFKAAIIKDLILHVGDDVAQNFSLEVGVVTDTITVTGEARPINTENATVGTVVERKVVENMPLNGRSFQGLITLTPGVATVASNGTATTQFVVNGQRSDTSYFSVDGVSANTAAPVGGALNSNGTGSSPTTSATGGFNNMVSIDALQEFRMSTSSFAPEFGRTPGGQISLVSRSGSNAFHGDVFDYFRNTVLDANDWFLNAASRGRGVVQQNDFGGVVGGNVIKNKLFFFASYEGLRLQAPSPSVKKVPTQASRALAAAANSGGVTGYMAPFANAYPLPDGNPATPCTSFATCALNYSASFPGKSVMDNTSIRGDYSLNKRMMLFGRYAHSPSSLVSENSVDRNAFDFGNDSYTAGWTWILSGAANNDLRFNFTHSTMMRGSVPLQYSGSFSSIFPPGYAAPASTYLSNPNSMSIQFGGLPTDGFALIPALANNGNDQRNITDSFGWVKGSHRFRFGIDWRQLDPAADNVNFNWNNQFAQNTTALTGFPASLNVCPASVLPAGAGATVPGYICGQATLSNIQHNFPQHFRYQQYSSYAQDTWRVSRRITLTYGVRWEVNPAFQYTSNNPGFSIQASSFNRSDLSKININPFGTAVFATTWGNFAPRAGIAWQLSDNPKWGRVLRAGYGIFYDTGAQAGTSLSNPFNGRFNNQGAGAIAPLIQFPLKTSDAIYVTAPTPKLTLPVSNGGNDILVDPNFKLPYVHQFNITLEQQIGSQQTLTASYVGALGKRLIGSLLYPAGAGNVAVFAQINPITGVATPDSLQIYGNYSSSDYHALQTKFQRQFAGGLSALVSYTWSHSIDDASVNHFGPTIVLPTPATLAGGRPIALLRGNSDFDIRHLFAFSAVYEIPGPKHGVARAFLGHWSIDPIFHYQTAAPLEIFTGATGSIGGTGYAQRPNIIPGVPVYVHGSDCTAQNGGQGCPGGMQLNIAPVSAATAASAGCVAPTGTNAKGAFCTPLPVGSQTVSGNLGRNIVRGFPVGELDFSLHREFPIHESIRLRFQVDMFNVFNHPNFGAQGGTVNGPTFGTTTLMANSSLGAGNSGGAGFNPIFNTGGPRNFQFALKLFF